MAYLPLQNALLGRLGRYSAVKNAPGSRPCGRLPPAQERKPQTKLPHLEVSADGTVTEAALGIFKQQLTSYKRLSGITSDDPDTVLQSLPPAAYSLLFARLGDDLIAQTEERLIASIQALTRAPLGYSAERAPLGGGQILPPCLTPELIGAARRARRRSKALNEKIPMHIKNFL